MALEYAYKVTAVRVVAQGDLPDVVREVEVNITGTDGAASFTLPATLQLTEASAETFTPFVELTEAQILAWVEAAPALEPVKAHVALVVAKEVERLSMQQKPLPWAPAPTPTDAGEPLANPEE